MSAFHPPLRPTPSGGTPAMTPRTITPLGSRAVQVSPLAFPLSDAELTAQVRVALQEDQAFNDVSTLATVVSSRHVRSAIVARRDGVIAGIPLAVEAFRQLDSAVTIRVETEDGTRVKAGDLIMHISGHARGMLSAERTALNYLQHLSGIATLTCRFVDAVAGTSVQILDTRKTTPGWRTLEKYAVRAGGGMNHRMDLRSGVLIKDNHLAAIGGDIAMAVTRARGLAMSGTAIEVECDTLEQVDAAIAAGADWVLLDNMSLDQLREAVERCRGKVITEASGGVTLETVRRIAETGVDRISVGALTHSAPALDLGLDFDGL
ncbi:carboxylating nicotinate-nucleotide diphosphorylase [Gemmatimonas groenlandica]|uniref:Probable nicotinate-nucleotide pyrophosphorylase [carboxylating] n=2 Tax=Gemmatimonas groenlandica TaxID=2732249 RepID=A0A6M4IQS4_9BACT|nr:carboxylating nicotinate-nucleotide diphosphorylase [Gemmatimonas groenlandica]